jgi:hypothetical protein
MIGQAEFYGFYVHQKYNFVLCWPKAGCRASPSLAMPSFFCFEDASDPDLPGTSGFKRAQKHQSTSAFINDAS